MRARRTIARIARLSTWIASLSLVALSGIASPAAKRQSRVATKKVIIDTDPGTDDALAILLAVNSPELDVRAITIVAGHVTADLGLENAIKVITLEVCVDISSV